MGERIDNKTLEFSLYSIAEMCGAVESVISYFQGELMPGSDSILNWLLLFRELITFL